MNPSHDLEPRIADYYATEAPSRAPDWLLVRALDTIGTTPQRRIGPRWPWRIPPMSHVAKLAVGAAAIVAITASGLTVLRQPEVGPVAPASLPPLTERFDSTFNGFSMDYPAGWQARRATEPWTSRAVTFAEPGADIMFDPALGEDLYIAVASEPLGDRGYREWPASIRNTFSSCDTFAALGCARSLLVTRDTRGYAIVLYLGDEGLADTYSDEWFQSVLDTLELRPGDASPASYEPLPSPLAPSPPPLTERLDSTSNGISMSYPAGWQTRPATEPWTGGALTFVEPGADIIFDPTHGEDLYLAVVSEPLEGRADHEWLKESLALACTQGEGGDGGYTLTLDGASGWVTQCAGARILTVVTDTRGYAIALHLGDEGLADTYSDDWFRSVLETVDLHPEEAAEAANLSSSANVVP